MRGWILAVSLSALWTVACGARTTGLADIDFAGDDAAALDGGVDGHLPSIDAPGIDTRPGIDARPDVVAVDVLGVDVTPPPDSGPPGDHTTGKACKDDSTCDVTGAGDAHCSVDLFSFGSISPTPTCINLNCDPGSGVGVVRCDGDLGICLPVDGGSSIPGLCIGSCRIDATSGSPAAGCVGKDVCNYYALDKDPSGRSVGVGYCLGGCTRDADCASTGETCQIETGECVRSHVDFKKKLGELCTASDFGVACSCYYGTGPGYCSQFCTVDGAACPSGYSCDGLLPSTDGSGSATFKTFPKGVAGYCLKECTSDGDCAALGGTCTASGGLAKKTCKAK